jgi:phage portal protein BeeE
VLPLVNRTAMAFTGWLAPAFGPGLSLKPNLDDVEALTFEREALWRRLDAATFLSRDEKREAAGYPPETSA